MSCVEASVESGQKREKVAVVLENRKVLEVSLSYVEGESMFLSDAKSQVRQLLVDWYHADLEQSLDAAPEDVGSIDVLAGELKEEGDWDLANWTGENVFRSRASILDD